LFSLRVFHADIVVSALMSMAKAAINEQENFRLFFVKTYLVAALLRQVHLWLIRLTFSLWLCGELYLVYPV
jgi:hypothetical protein